LQVELVEDPQTVVEVVEPEVTDLQFQENLLVGDLQRKAHLKSSRAIITP
jgi:hypothetical protein